MHERFLREAALAGLPSGPGPESLITEADLAALPEVVQRYLRFMRVLDRPRDWSFRGQWSGRFRMSPTEVWLPCEALSYVSRLAVARIFHMSLRLRGFLPVLVRDTYLEGRGQMLGRVMDLVTVVDETGPELDLGELVTYLNDAILLAPSMLLGPEVKWTAVDDASFDVALSDRGRTVLARVEVDADGAPLDFATTDRFVHDPTQPGAAMIRARWRTPVLGWQVTDGRPLPTRARALWELPAGPFAYADFHLDPQTAAFNVPPGL
jgi:hypothetical protein